MRKLALLAEQYEKSVTELNQKQSVSCTLLVALPFKDGSTPLMSLPKAQKVDLPASSPHCPLMLSVEQKSCEYRFLMRF